MIVAQELRAGIQRPQDQKALERNVLKVFTRASRTITPSPDAWHRSGDLLAEMVRQEGLEIARVSKAFANDVLLARCPHRPVVLPEGPRPPRMPDVHPHALKGAMVSLAVMWRLPVLCARDPDDSLRILRFLAQQLGNSTHGVLKRYDRKPRRDASRKLYALQGLPGVGPALARRLLVEFGSVERVR